MSINLNQVLIAPVVSEKSYAEIENGKYSFRVHQDAHKTQVRQAVEQAFNVKVARVNILQVPREAEAARPHQGHAPRLEEGHRQAPPRPGDRDLPGPQPLI